MFWLLFTLTIIFLVILKYKDTYGTSQFALIFCIPSLIFMVEGATCYMSLLGKKTEVLSLQQEIKSIQQARYSNVTSGSLVGGSLDNLQQSTNLSEYIRQYAKIKATYNRFVVETQFRKKNSFMWLFGDALFLDNRVLELEKIE